MHIRSLKTSASQIQTLLYSDTISEIKRNLIVTKRSPHNNVTRSGLEFIVRKIADRVKEKLSVPVTPHVFRHTTATQALANGMPVQNVQLMLGHRNLNTTMVYAEVNQQNVRRAHVTTVI